MPAQRDIPPPDRHFPASEPEFPNQGLEQTLFSSILWGFEGQAAVTKALLVSSFLFTSHDKLLLDFDTDKKVQQWPVYSINYRPGQKEESCLFCIFNLHPYFIGCHKPI